MRHAYILATVFLLAIGDSARATDAPETLADNPRLSVMLDEDQADRVPWRAKNRPPPADVPRYGSVSVFGRHSALPDGRMYPIERPGITRG